MKTGEDKDGYKNVNGVKTGIGKSGTSIVFLKVIYYYTNN